MPTQKPLQDLIPDLIKHIRENEEVIENHLKLFEIYDKQLTKYLHEDIDKEISRTQVRKEMKNRASPINMLPRIIDKISTIYDVEASRTLESETSQTLLEEISEEIDLDVQLQHAAELVQLNGACGIEPYLNTKGEPRVRVLALHEFIVWSDDPKDLKNPTVFIKFMGEKMKEIRVVNSDGLSTLDADTKMERVALYHVYSDTEFLVIDSMGDIDDEEMSRLGSDGTNPLGFIPLIYANASKTRLIPLPDVDSFQLSKVFPLMFTDLNHATKYQSHGLIAVFGAEKANRPAGPGDIWHIDPIQPGDGESPIMPSVEVVQPNVDSDKATGLIVEQLTLWLDTKGVKAGSTGKLQAGNLASGVAKIIDEADASQAVSKLKGMFKKVEHSLFSMLKELHNEFWSSIAGYSIQGGKFSSDDKLVLEFGIQQTVASSRAITDEQILLLDNKLTTRRKALKAIHPNLSDSEIEDLITEIDKESEEQIKKAQEAMMDNMEVNNAQSNGNGSEQGQVDDSDDGSNPFEQ